MLQILERFKTLISCILLVSLVMYIAVVYVGLNLPHITIMPLNETKDYLYNNYYLLLVPTNVRDIQLLYRFHAIFEEPGVVSTIATTFLIMDRFRLNLWRNVVLFISGIVSFSLFFYVVTILFFVFQYRKIVNIKFIIPAIISIVALLVINSYYQTDIDLTQLVSDRLSIGNGHLGGDNRSSESFNRAYDALWGSSDLLFGKGLNAHMAIDSKISTYKMIIYDYGLIYIMISLLIMVLYGIKTCRKNKKIFLLYILYILMFYYQRPTFIYMSGIFFMFISLPFALKHDYENN
ncbi:hypothetical protein [Bacteroides zoogleoformans]|nr:hypothetical protein [Bacteroides zoogleoformans]